MAHQPLYGTINDEIGERSPHSWRGRVDNISFWLNSHFGEVFSISARSSGSLHRKDVREAEGKLLAWSLKNNFKKVDEWKKKREEREAYNTEQESKEFVAVDIDLKNLNKKFKFLVNGYDVMELIKKEKLIEAL